MRNLRSSRSPLEIGALSALATLGLAGILGIVAVLDADGVGTAFGTGFGVAFVVFVAGATTVCALACLARGRVELIALASLLLTGVALDLLILAIWRDIEDETYAKIVGIAFAWSFFALIALGLTLAVASPGRLARWTYVGAIASTVGAGLISTYLIATAGDEDASGMTTEGTGFYIAPVDVGDDALLRALGAAFVLIAALWFGAIAAHRLEQSPRPSA